MNCTAYKIPYADTGYFSGIVTDYLSANSALKEFYGNPATWEGMAAQIKTRLDFATDRSLLVRGFSQQYETLHHSPAVKKNIQLLAAGTTFTITTAHQPNIFTGPLYFIYKIFHAIKLAEESKKRFPQYDFVPVFFMGSEDADLEELGHIYLDGEKLAWETEQTGAVGRMQTDAKVAALIDRIESQTGVFPYSGEIMSLIKRFYTPGTDIQTATLGFVNALFGQYGLLVMVPDSPVFKAAATELFKDDLLNQHAARQVEKTGQALQEKGYKVQAHGREINLFYLKDALRQRIVKKADLWEVKNTTLSFTRESLLEEVDQHPERFSPNVILRGLFQEMLLPNLAYIGGGGELAYWLQLKGLFHFYKVPYPLLVLRNSFLIVDRNASETMQKTGVRMESIFQSLKTLQDQWVKANAQRTLSVEDQLEIIKAAYTNLNQKAAAIDPTLSGHVETLKVFASKKIEQLGKKMLRAEKRNHADAMRQIEKLKNRLFPLNNLQERIDNIIPYYARWGYKFLEALYQHSLSLEQEYTVLTC